MSRHPVQDEFTGQRARNVRSTVHPASLSDRSCNCLGTSGMLERKLNRVRQDGVRILERTAKREGRAAAGARRWDPRRGHLERLGPSSIPA